MDETERLAETLKALADPTRLKLLQLLVQNSAGQGACEAEMCDGSGFLCVNALAHKLGITQSAVSQHLRVLRQAGLVNSERRGSFAHYTLDSEGIAGVQTSLRNTLGEELSTT